jgi:hypothetical protein
MLMPQTHIIIIISSSSSSSGSVSCSGICSVSGGG